MDKSQDDVFENVHGLFQKHHNHCNGHATGSFGIRQIGLCYCFVQANIIDKHILRSS